MSKRRTAEGRWRWVTKRGDGKAGLHDLMLAIISPHWVARWELRYQVWVRAERRGKR